MSNRQYIMLSQSRSLRFCKVPQPIISVKLLVRLYRSYGNGAWDVLASSAVGILRADLMFFLRKQKVTFATLGIPAPRQGIYLASVLMTSFWFWVEYSEQISLFCL